MRLKTKLTLSHLSIAMLVVVSGMSAIYVVVMPQGLSTPSPQGLVLTRTVVIMTVLIAVILAITLSQRVHHNIAGPLAELTEAAEKFSRGQLDLEVDVSSVGEIDKLAHVFKTMTQRINQNHALLESKIQDAQRARARLEAEIAERKTLEDIWRRYEFIVNTSQDFMCLINVERIHEAVNEAYCKARNTPTAEVVGRGLAEIWGPDYPSKLAPPVDRCFQEQKVNFQDWFDLPGQGKRFIDVTCYPYSNGQQLVTHAVIVARDITELRTAEDRSRQHQEELAHMARLKTLGEMASVLAHELNQPLCAIVTSSQACVRMLESALGDSPDLLSGLEQIALQGRRAGEIIEHMRHFARKEDPQCLPADINTLAQDALNLCRHMARQHGVDIELDLHEPLPPVGADVLQVEQVVLNLVKNAIESMCEVDEPQRHLVLRTACPDGASVEVCVEDSGSGFSDGAEEKLFESFYSTKEKGLGVGLSLSRSIIEAHGGRLWCRRRPEGGSIFRFTLPVFIGEAAHA